MPDFKSSSESFVEGIGNDVVYATLILLLLVGLVFAYFFCWYHRVAEPAIHAASSQRVAEVREIRNRLQHGNDETEFRRERRANYSFCPVCLGNAQYPVETNCGHVFCGQCIITYWETAQDRMETVRCPTCRQQVTVLLPCFSDAEIASSSGDGQLTMASINLYNRRFSGRPLTWMEYLNDLPTMLRHCLADFFSFSGLLWMFRLRVLLCFVVALMYLVSPLDIIPEAVFGFFGLLDDVFITLLLLVYVSVMYRRLIAERAEIAANQ